MAKEHKGRIYELSGPEGCGAQDFVVSGIMRDEGWERFTVSNLTDHVIHLYVEVIGLVDDIAPSRNWVRDSSLVEDKK